MLGELEETQHRALQKARGTDLSQYRLDLTGRSWPGTGPPASPSLLFWLAEPARGIPRLRLQMRARGSGTTSGAHSAAGRAGGRKARAPAVTRHSAASPTPRRRGSRYLLSSLSNWWAAVPPPSRLLRGPLGPCSRPGHLSNWPGLRLALPPPPTTLPPRTRSSRASVPGRPAGREHEAAGAPHLPDGEADPRLRARAGARTRTRHKRAWRRPRGRDRAAASGRGARGARAPHPRAAERYFGWQEAPRHFRRAVCRAGASLPRVRRAGKLAAGVQRPRRLLLVASRPSAVQAMNWSPGGTHTRTEWRSRRRLGSDGEAQWSRARFPPGRRSHRCYPPCAKRHCSLETRHKSCFLRAARPARQRPARQRPAASEAPHLKAAQTAELVLCLSSAPHAEPTPCSWLWSWNLWANGLRVK